jgi:hypothetical protein
MRSREECLWADVTFLGLPTLYRVWSRLAPISEIEKEIVMKNIAAVALFIAATFISAGPAPAQDHQAKATVPFYFTVGNQTLPSGTYTIGSASTDRNLITMRNWDKKVTVMSLGHPNQGNSGQDNRLVFHKYGNQYFLSEIRSDGASIDIHFPTTKAEKQAKVHAEEARLSVDDPVLIALK